MILMSDKTICGLDYGEFQMDKYDIMKREGKYCFSNDDIYPKLIIQEIKLQLMKDSVTFGDCKKVYSPLPNIDSTPFQFGIDIIENQFRWVIYCECNNKKYIDKMCSFAKAEADRFTNIYIETLKAFRDKKYD